jgi:gliding motility associated protien GldN
MNLPFAYPPRPLIQIIQEAALHGDLKVYDPAIENADQFKRVMDTAEVARIGAKRDTVIQINPVNPEKEDTVEVNNTLQYYRISKYRVKEVWFFDTRTSSMQVRIIGIAPVMEDYDEKGNYRGDMTMYWVYFNDLRDLLAKEEVFNPQNDRQHMSWDDLFSMRYFASYIYKESNVFDRNIQEYASGTDALLESDRIKQSIFETEHDMWEY